MQNRLIRLMESENLNPKKFSELLGVQPSAISHILSGRNKPSYDLIVKILTAFPRLNPSWLLLEKGEMYLQVQPENATNSNASHNHETDDIELNISEFIPSKPDIQKIPEIERVLVLYSDGSFSQYDKHKI